MAPTLGFRGPWVPGDRLYVGNATQAKQNSAFL